MPAAPGVTKNKKIKRVNLPKKTKKIKRGEKKIKKVGGFKKMIVSIALTYLYFAINCHQLHYCS